MMSEGGTIAPQRATVAERVGPVRWADRARGPSASVEDADHNANVTRVRRVMPAALVLWVACTGLDVTVVRWVEPGPLGYFLVLRVVEVVVLALTLWRLARPPTVTPFALRVMTIGIYTSASLLVGLMALRNLGLESPYAHGVSAIIVVGGVTMPDRWRRGAFALGLPALAYPAVVLASAAWDPRVASQLASPVSRMVFVQHVAIIFVVWMLLVAGGHLIWSLRRQVFEAREIGRYRLGRRIGGGGMGEVWLAKHATLRRDVAIKILRPDPSTPAAAFERFEREVAATSELSHPNTVRVFDYGVTEDGLRYFVMELLEGESLAAMVEREGPLPPARALHLLHQAARAMAEAHARGIVHRDIKPENLMVTELGGEADFLKVLDFGIAKLEEGAMGARLTGAGVVVGTPAFMSPEQAASGAASTRFDVYSLGAVLYFALTGRPPFGGDDVVEVARAQAEGVLVPPSQVVAAVPADVDAVVMRCLERQPGARYQDAQELADALARCASFGSWRAEAQRYLASPTGHATPVPPRPQ